MTDRQWGDYLEDILEAVESIEEFIQGMTADEFISDKKTKYAVVRSLEVIGEASKNIPESVKVKFPDVPWKDMAGMRDKVIHYYFGIDYNVVWKTIKEDVPFIKPILRGMLNSIDRQDTDKNANE
jgi:uncharacterized protein with HEPN domain